VLLEPTLSSVGVPSFVEFLILEPGNTKKCNMLFGISVSISSHLLHSALDFSPVTVIALNKKF
jgi:hypothetical protein